MATREVKAAFNELRQKHRVAQDKEIKALEKVTLSLATLQREARAAVPNMQRGALVIHDQGRVHAAQDAVTRAYEAYYDASEELGVMNRTLIAFIRKYPEFE